MSEQESLVDRVRDDVLKTGFPTEVVTASHLESAGWKTMLGLSYMDENTGQSREFDVRAYQEIFGCYIDSTDYSFGVYLLIECKKSQKPWVVFTSPNDHDARLGPDQRKFIHTTPHLDGFIRPAVTKRDVLLSDALLSANHHYFEGRRWGHSYYEAFKGREQADRSTQIFTAINSVVNATRFYTHRFDRPNKWRPLVYPVIVLEGDLFESEVSPDGGVAITPRDHLILKHHMIPPEYDRRGDFNGVNYLIDIVRSTHVEEYAKKLANAHRLLIDEVNRAARFRDS